MRRRGCDKNDDVSEAVMLAKSSTLKEHSFVNVENAKDKILEGDPNLKRR